MIKSTAQQKTPSLTKNLGPALRDTFTVKLIGGDGEE